MDPGTLAAILTIGTIVVGLSSAGATHLLHRRAASGRVGTSEASVLWDQAQDMRSTLLEEKNKAEEQRDRLIEAYTNQILPTLAAMHQLIQDVSVSAAEGVRLMHRISAALGEEDEHVASSQARDPGR